jgi:hypothetical protein
MAPELTSTTVMFGIIFITQNDIRANKLGQSFTTKVSETTLMPKTGVATRVAVLVEGKKNR